MNQTITYGVDVPWSQLVDFLDEKFLDLMCKRLHVSREQISNIPFFISSSSSNTLFFFNVVDISLEKR